MTQEDFASADPRTLYDHMRPDQRTAIANEFVRYLRLAEDPAVEQFDAEERARRTGDVDAGTTKRGFNAVAPQRESAEEVASIHAYTREHHPDIFEQVAYHPVTGASLANPAPPSMKRSGKRMSSSKCCPQQSTRISRIAARSPTTTPALRPTRSSHGPRKSAPDATACADGDLTRASSSFARSVTARNMQAIVLP